MNPGPNLSPESIPYATPVRCPIGNWGWWILGGAGCVAVVLLLFDVLFFSSKPNIPAPKTVRPMPAATTAARPTTVGVR